MSYVYTYGSGTENDPYQVWTADDLDGVRDHLTSHFKQMDDIDMSGWGNFTPIAYDDWDNVFTGKYNGNNKEIIDIQIQEEAYVALFGLVGGGGTFTNIIFVNPIVAAMDTNAGCLIGFVWRDSGDSGELILVENCHIKTAGGGAATITTHPSGDWAFGVGGIVSEAYPNIKISKCSVTGDVTISSSASSVRGWHSGGIAGYIGKTALIEECYVGETVLVEANERSGGIVGSLEGGKILNCYSRAGVWAKDKGGGICGRAGKWDSDVAELEHVYFAGTITEAGSGSDFGGLIGDDAAPGETIITNSYYDSVTSGQSDTGKGEPRTTAQMVYPYTDKHASGTYVDWEFEEKHITDLTGYDFVFGVPWLHDHDASVNDGYPILFRPEILFAVYSKIVAAWKSGPAWIKKDGQWKSVTDGWIKEGGAWKPIIP